MSVLIAQSTIIHLGSEAVNQGLPFANGLTSSDGGFGAFLSTILGAVLLIAALLVLLYLLWGAIEWISSGGDKGKTEKARDRMTQAIIGLIVLAATVAIFSIVEGFLGVNILSFSGGTSGSGSSSSSSSSGGSGAATCNGVAQGKTISDNGAGGYCTNGGAANVICSPANANLPYVHFEPVSCAGNNQPAYTWK